MGVLVDAAPTGTEKFFRLKNVAAETRSRLSSRKILTLQKIMSFQIKQQHLFSNEAFLDDFLARFCSSAKYFEPLAGE